jgi:hypothetical protein
VQEAWKWVGLENLSVYGESETVLPAARVEAMLAAPRPPAYRPRFRTCYADLAFAAGRFPSSGEDVH